MHENMKFNPDGLEKVISVDFKGVTLTVSKKDVLYISRASL